jgi:SAM-dependent methyltransferase
MAERVQRFDPDKSLHGRSDYGALWAPYYDAIYDIVEDYTIDLLAGFAGTPGTALEFAVGSGRIAIPLAARGVAVTGVDISEDMVALLRAKPGGEAVEVVMGDMSEISLGRRFPLVYLPFNTLFTLLDQASQVQCFVNAARHLESGGRFVLDCFVPDQKRYDSHNTRMGVSSIGSDTEHAYELSIHHPVEQRVTSHHVRRQSDGSSLVLPVNIRYAWPSEMDLMARIAGLELEDRWGWYDKRPFTSAVDQHVSVYRKIG